MRTPVVVILVAAVLVGGIVALRLQSRGPSAASAVHALATGCSQVRRPFAQHISGPFLTMSGRVMRLLPDSLGTRLHQRFIVACTTGQTILVVNDVSVGERAPVHVGDRIALRGQYIWNAQGGLIHFTHHNSTGGNAGWIYDRGKVYS